MKVLMPVRTVLDRKGNIVHQEIEERVLTEEQLEAICALLLNNLAERRKSHA